jgi:hypothetical protein
MIEIADEPLKDNVEAFPDSAAARRRDSARNAPCPSGWCRHHRARLVQNGPTCTGGGPRIGKKAKREGAPPRPSPYIKKLERVQMPNALYRRTADRLRPSGCYGSSAGTSGCAGSSP